MGIVHFKPEGEGDGLLSEVSNGKDGNIRRYVFSVSKNTVKTFEG